MLHTEELTLETLKFPGLNYKGLEGTVLATIINAKVKDVGNLCVTGKRTAPHRSLSEALEKKAGRNFILECKQSSPTLGDFCKDFDLDKLISCYEKRACAISVLCEEHFFKGSLDYLKYVKDHCSLPVICKDFIICKKQIDAAYVAGADAVLLMLSVLDKETFEELYAYAHSLNLDVLTEVDYREDALYVKSRNIEIVGINNRNLRTLEVNLDNAKELSKLFDDSVKIVSESGIHTHQDLVYLNPVRNFLIGSSLTAQKDVIFKANSMLYGLNKLCGLTTKEAVQAAVDCHVSIGGLIFAKKSPRFVTDEVAQEFVSAFKCQIRFAGVFVDENIQVMADKAEKLSLDYLQLHGNESLDTIRQLREKLPEIGIIKAFNITDSDSFSKVNDYLECCDLIILDSKNPGSGSSFDWDTVPDTLDKSKCLLSGGIGQDNVLKALSYGFAGLDLNSKLEREKGIKDVKLIKDVFTLINNY
ncbi:MAG: bifunctional indole-3-glycerol-phosphate synthase TrpC/phosphoribosylanthranilate isomerase TrpF [Succinivibrio sp.]